MNASAETLAVQSTLSSLGLDWDRSRGRFGMVLFIITEAMLFVALFFSNFYLGGQDPHWPMDALPKLHYSIPMLAILVSSSFVLYGAERFVTRGRHLAARITVWATMALGLLFLYLQSREYQEHLKSLRPDSDAYGSLFYTITSLHAAHLILGLFVLGYASTLPLQPVPKPPYKPLRTAALYWHFVDAMWVVIVGLLYLLPRINGNPP
jgi:cytochrome c oxidase subunit 3/cytochrome c oxidase subunit I+III